MFKKLLSNLPFNPSLITQVSFYAKRLHKEESLRRTGLVLLVLAMAVQFFAVASPPEATLASSNNDLISGGIRSVNGAVQACETNQAHYGDILHYYDISCDDVSRASTVTIHSTDYDRQLYSMGRLAYGKAGETPVGIGGVTYWFRYLWGWDTGGASSYTALKFTNSSGKTFFILYTCGNLVSIGLPTVPPSLQITKSTMPGTPADKSVVAPGQVLGYRVYFSNPGGAANNTYIEDPIPANTTWTGWQGSGGANQFSVDSGAFPEHSPIPHAWWLYGQLPANASGYYVDFTVKVNANAPDGSSICNVAFIRSDEFPIKQSNEICMTVSNKPKLPPPPTLPPCQYDNTLPADSPNCKPCQSSQNTQDQLACLDFHKSASNLTQNITEANGTTAQPNDKLQYKLQIHNTGKTTFKGFIVQDSLSDVLDYANITDAHGGKLDENGNLIWPAVDIPAGGTIEKLIDVQVKSIIPETPASPTDPGHYDLVMTNVYKNAINIKVPGAPAKTVAVVTTTKLPNTGPSTSMYIGVSLVIVVAYFFARTRLLAKELDIVRYEQTTAGGF